MIPNRFFKNISYNTFQLVINQIFGFAIFYGLSKGLDKNIFGQINWTLAVLLTFFGILAMGIDQVMVKKIAAGYNRQSIFSIYAFHVMISGGCFYGILLLTSFCFPHTQYQQSLLLFLGLGKLFIFISTPFKQLASGLEKFREFFLMSIASNIIRGVSIIILLSLHKVSVPNILIIFLSGDFTELVLCFLIGRLLLPQNVFRLKWNRRRQIIITKESLPQTGVVLFTSIMSRFDWILVGLFISATKLAEYSFAYKIFEVSTLPLLIVAPIMIPLFTRLNKLSKNINELFFFVEWQIIVASLIALLLNICWVPVIDYISDGKYGKVNSGIIFLLSLSMPLLYFTNYMWTIHFTNGNLKYIFKIMAISFAINILGCFILIPVYKNKGAATAYLITILSQLFLYIRKKPMLISNTRIYFLVFWPLAAIGAGCIGIFFSTQIGTRVFTATIIYLIAVLVSKRVAVKNWKTLRSLYQ